jgi:putative FmdB family regulatory protein
MNPMPIYEYRCQACDERFDKLVRSSRREGVEILCPVCQSGDVRRLISAPAVHTGDQDSPGQGTAESAPAQPEVFGRKELNKALRNKSS